MYSSGLRISEVCPLRYEDIHRNQKMIHIPLSKNWQDRYTILSDKNLEILTEYWYRYNRSMGWLFPSTLRNEPLTNSAVGLFIKQHAQRLGVPKGVNPHTMRHCLSCAWGWNQPHLYPTIIGSPQPRLDRCISTDDIQGIHGDPKSFWYFWEQKMRRMDVMMDNPTMQDVLRHFYSKYLNSYTPTECESCSLHLKL